MRLAGSSAHGRMLPVLRRRRTESQDEKASWNERRHGVSEQARGGRRSGDRRADAGSARRPASDDGDGGECAQADGQQA